jgi:hypothetical protein
MRRPRPLRGCRAIGEKNTYQFLKEIIFQPRCSTTNTWARSSPPPPPPPQPHLRSNFLVPVHAMTAYQGSTSTAIRILKTSVPDGVEWPASQPGRFTTGGTNLDIRLVGDCMSPTDGMDVVLEKRQASCPPAKQTPHRPGGCYPGSNHPNSQLRVIFHYLQRDFFETDSTTKEKLIYQFHPIRPNTPSLVSSQSLLPWTYFVNCIYQEVPHYVMSQTTYLSHPVKVEIFHCHSDIRDLCSSFSYSYLKNWKLFFANPDVPWARHTADLLLFIPCILFVINYTYQQIHI